eukprot:TRINITY_DN396_c0_g1_i1.p1 TRINITY_DN396_c0_g1~~TRINITY_DN396_c0_g1_i1.p1  ORF type:complete len:146 (-),score=45.59 TRINITY_DN396_c0_g1_i1:65-502(-)
MSEGDAEVITPTTTEGTAEGQVMDVFTALKEVLKKALIHDGVARGLSECVKALDKRNARLCVLAQDCAEPTYVKLVEALCVEHSINLIKVPEGKQLGEWVGLCKLDKEAKPRRVVNCSCVVVKNYGEESDALSILLNYFQTRGGQ